MSYSFLLLFAYQREIVPARVFLSHSRQKASLFIVEHRAVGYSREVLNWNLVHYCMFKIHGAYGTKMKPGEKGKSSDTGTIM